MPITRKTTTPLMGLNWIQRLGIHLNTNNSKIQIHNIQPGDIEEKIADLKNEFKGLFYNNNEIKDLSVKVNLKEGAQTNQQKGKTNTGTSTRPRSKRTETTDGKRIFRKSNRKYRRLFCKPCSNYCETELSCYSSQKFLICCLVSSQTLYQYGCSCRGVSIFWFTLFLSKNNTRFCAIDYLLDRSWRDSLEMYENLGQNWQPSWGEKCFRQMKLCCEVC